VPACWLARRRRHCGGHRARSPLSASIPVGSCFVVTVVWPPLLFCLAGWVLCKHPASPTFPVSIRRVPRLFDLHAVPSTMFCCFFQFQGSNS
jgi:hypothetical protein